MPLLLTKVQMNKAPEVTAVYHLTIPSHPLPGPLPWPARVLGQQKVELLITDLQQLLRLQPDGTVLGREDRAVHSHAVLAHDVELPGLCKEQGR